MADAPDVEDHAAGGGEGVEDLGGGLWGGGFEGGLEVVVGWGGGA